MPANKLHHIGLMTLLLATAISTGCQSGGSRLAWMNPWNKKAEDASLVARSAPTLPSEQVAAAEQDKPAVSMPNTAIKPSTAPAFDPTATSSAASTIAAAPTATYPTTASATAPGAAAYPATASANTLGVTPPATGTPPAVATPPAYATASIPKAPTSTAGPYDVNGYQEPAKPAAPSFQPDRYAGLSLPSSTPTANAPSNPAVSQSPTLSSSLGDRYSSLASPASLAAAPHSAPPTTPLPGAPASRYATTASPEMPAASVPTKQTTPMAAPPVTASVPQVAQASAEVKLTAPAGSYRPAGTSTYPTAVAVATRPAPPATTQPPVTGTTGGRYGTTPAPQATPYPSAGSYR